MRLLLDTHVLLWAMQDSPRLKAEARRLLNLAQSLHVSSVSLWEIQIKRALGRLRIDPDALDAHLAAGPIQPLAVTWEHARALRALPAHHADPFDRMLVAQAMSESLHLMTNDASLRPYSELVIVV